jgi:hypothetical protein
MFSMMLELASVLHSSDLPENLAQRKKLIAGRLEMCQHVELVTMQMPQPVPLRNKELAQY